jgi:HEAT repeat protein
MKLQVDPGRDALLAQLGCTTDWFAAADAARGLGRAVGDADVREALSEALAQPRFFAAKRAIAAALASVGGPASRDALVAQLGDRDLRARRGIVRALGEFKSDAVAAAALRRAWNAQKSYFVRAEILAALSRIGAPDTFEFLVRALDVPSFRDVIRSAALRGLAELEDERGIDKALAWIAPGPSRWARDAAMRSAALLGRLYPARARVVQDALERVLAEGSFFGVLSSVDALGKLGRAQALSALRRVAAADIDGRLQKAAREAAEALVSGSQPPETLRALRSQIDALHGENRALRSRLERIEAQMDLRSNGARPRRRAAPPQARGGRKRSG